MRTALACVAAAAALAYAAADASAHRRIAFDHTAADGTEDVLTIPARGGEARQVTHMLAGHGAELPAWSAGGRALYFDSDVAGGIHLFVTDALGRAQRQLTRGDGTEFSARPSRSGALLAFEHENAASTRGGIFVARRAFGLLYDVRQITASPALASGGFDTEPDFSPDGSRLAFLRVLDAARGGARAAVFVVGVDGRHLRQLTPYALDAIQPRWAPDGSRLLFSSNADNATDAISANVYSVRPDGAGLTQLTHEAAGGQAFTADWAPDGIRIAYAHVAPGADRTDLVVRNLRTGATTTIRQGAPGTADQDLDWEP